ncbi:MULTISPECIES: helix-turn-helix transcriptional regulator [Burkholderia]|uniref:helix-turn-helix transcriptional regulator n=1 Tax=Burkholderia TaxID=32008 RepID=UPI001FC83962|nr:helix-turn-helix domain-containing protein [Burkholderia cenocepacia]
MSESDAKTHHFHSNDPEEVSDFIEKIYADNHFRAQHAEKRDVNMGGQEWRGIGIYDVDYEMPFSFHSEEARPNYLFLSCERGGSTYSTSDSIAQCTIGDMIPISSTGNSICKTKPEGFGHLSVILDAIHVNDFLAQWIGRPLTQPIRFDLRPVQPDIASQWNIAASCMRQMMSMSPLPDTAVRALYEHMLKLVIHGHASNYSELLANGRYAPEHVVRSAIAMIESDPIRWRTLGAIAHALGCATQVLENGIRRWTSKGSDSIFYEARLRCVNRALTFDSCRSFIDTLRAYNFTPSPRFVRTYRNHFGESPSETYRRNPNAVGATALDFGQFADQLSEQILNRFINASLDQPISLADIARHADLSEHATIIAFKERFAKTPMQYVIERRLERARWLLCHTSVSILSIALSCGFGSQSYLTTQIKRYYGVTPRQLRLSARTTTSDDNRSR